ncbi:hypothetical protein K438DRAFT_1865083 [Mycena galopus ATCC 62051]|nr:hypothetical protein K438DRAFT_1865083 [Mycena galopus ATCC 62051]
MPPLGPIINLYPLFHNLLVNSPHLTCHIQMLHLGLHPLQSEISASIAALSADDWAKIEEFIVDFLPLLCGKGLESLGLFPCGPGINKTEPTSGRRYVVGELHSKGLQVQKEWVRKSLARVDGLGQLLWQQNMRWRVYTVPRPNYLWHCDGHHKLIW